jgi:GTP cyclohydrolase IA
MMREGAEDVNEKTVSEAATGTFGKARAPISPEEFARFQAYAAEIFSRLGMDTASPGSQATPRRWLQAIIDMTAGYDRDPKISTIFPRECVACEEGEYEQTVEGPIPFVSLCEHHVLPFVGHAWVGYLRRDKIIGISKFTRIVRMYARRFTLQERIAQEVVHELTTLLNPHGVAVYLEAHHTCTQARGVHEANAKTRTFLSRGAYQGNSYLTSEFMDLAGLRRP